MAFFDFQMTLRDTYLVFASFFRHVDKYVLHTYRPSLTVVRCFLQGFRFILSELSRARYTPYAVVIWRLQQGLWVCIACQPQGFSLHELLHSTSKKCILFVHKLKVASLTFPFSRHFFDTPSSPQEDSCGYWQTFHISLWREQRCVYDPGENTSIGNTQFGPYTHDNMVHVCWGVTDFPLRDQKDKLGLPRG